MKPCPVCKTENSDEAKYCTKCGAALESRCRFCGAETKQNDRYCSACGKPWRKKTFYVARPKLTDRFFAILRAGAIFALALYAFFLSFFGAAKIETKSYFDQSNVLPTGISSLVAENLSVETSTVDLIEAAFRSIKPEKTEKVVEDLVWFMSKNLTKEEIELLGESNPLYAYRQAEIYNEILEDFNFLKLVVSEDFIKEMPSMRTALWLTTGLAVGYMGLTLAFAVLSFLHLLRIVTDKEKTFKTPMLTLGFLSLGFAVALAFGLRLFGFTKGGAALGIGITALLIALVGDYIVALFKKETKLDKRKLFRYVSLATSVAIAITVCFLVCGNLVKAVCATDSMREVSASYDASSLAQAWDNLKAANKLKGTENSLYGTAETLIPTLLQAYDQGRIDFNVLKEALSPAMMGVLGEKEIETALASVGIFVYVAALGTIVTAALSIAERARALRFDRKPKLVYTLLPLAFAVITVVLTFVYGSFVNDTMQRVAAVQYRTYLSGTAITLGVFAVVDLVQQIAFSLLQKKQATPPTIAETTEAEPLETPTQTEHE